MTTNQKDFDCVEMKNEIQQRLQKEWEGLTAEEIQKRIHDDLSTSDSPIAQWWRKIRAEQDARSKK